MTKCAVPRNLHLHFKQNFLKKRLPLGKIATFVRHIYYYQDAVTVEELFV
jgi:hypothetical protein